MAGFSLFEEFQIVGSILDKKMNNKNFNKKTLIHNQHITSNSSAKSNLIWGAISFGTEFAPKLHFLKRIIKATEHMYYGWYQVISVIS